MQLPPGGGTLARLPIASTGAGMASKAMLGIDAGNVMADTGTRERKTVEGFGLVPAVKKLRKKRKMRVQPTREPTASAEPQQPHLVAALAVLADGPTPARGQHRPEADAMVFGEAPRLDPNRHVVLVAGDPRGNVQFLARARPTGRSPSRPHGHFGPELAQNQP